MSSPAEEAQVREATRRSVSEAKRKDVRKAKFAKGYAEIALQPADALVHDMARRHPRLRVFGLNPGLIHSDIRTGLLGRGVTFKLVEWIIGALFVSAHEYAERIRFRCRGLQRVRRRARRTSGLCSGG